MWLQNLSLPGPDSRERTKFVDILLKQIAKIAGRKLELLKKYASKDSEGDPSIILSEDGKKVYDVPKESVDSLNKEYNEHLQSDLVLDVTGSAKENFQNVRRIILFTDYKFGPGEKDEGTVRALKMKQAMDYAEWCNALEAVQIA